MTTDTGVKHKDDCPAENLLKTLSGKWKPQLFRLASSQPIRFNNVLKQLSGCNKQSLSKALKEMEDAGLFEKIVINQKPLHIEHKLTDKGRLMLPVFEQIEKLL